MTTRKQTSPRECWKYFRELSARWSSNFDHTFYRLGKLIASRPVFFLLLSLVLCLASSLGLIFWKEEVDEVELFMPPDSRIRRNAIWVEENFRDDLRFESIIVEADNVLTAPVLSTIAELETTVRGIDASGHNWTDVCARYLTWFPNDNENNTISEIRRYMKDFKDDCIYQSLLRIWTINGTMDSIYKLDQYKIIKDITNAVNGTKKSAGKFASHLENVKPLLSGIRWDSEGNIIGANATIVNWILKKTNKWSPVWELEFIQNILFSNRSLPAGVKIYAVSTRSYDDFLHQVLQNNQTLLFAGFSLIIVYVMAMLGRFNVVEQRVYLSLLGVSVVGQAILASYGTCYYMGFFWGPIHPVLPFLLLGIGVDNIFVIMQCLDNLKKEDVTVDVPDRIGKALKHAGVSITVTSLTDILAFAIGTSTVMPFLRSFCMFAAVGVLYLYVFDILFFVSCLSIDEKRLQQNRDGCICAVHKNWKPNECSQRNIQKLIFTKYVGPILMKPTIKVCVLAGTLLIFALNVWFIFKVEQKFDPVWYLNPESYPMQYNAKLNEHFPEYGKRAAIYIGNEIDYFEDRDKLYQLYSLLEENPYINKETLDFWYIKYQDWFNLTYPDVDITSEEELKGYLFEFLLMSRAGQKYVKDIKFSAFPFGDYNITASQLQIQHILMDTTTEQVKAMESLQEIIKSVNFSKDDVVSYSAQYVSWTANKIIGEELLRNLGLTICAVAIVTLILIHNLQASFWVICCVIFTVTDLMGSMYWLNLTIEISTSIMLLLCAGLAVDYSAHIGHEFTRLQGTKDERAVKTLSLIGSAVFNGGLSTFLAFILLGSSESYLFTTFFKLFTGVVVFGIFHALVFLPVALSWFGPPARRIIENNSSQHDEDTSHRKNGYFSTYVKDLEGGDSAKLENKDSNTKDDLLENQETSKLSCDCNSKLSTISDGL